jgi:ATP-dependent Clp protease adaptor protein ClpS
MSEIFEKKKQKQKQNLLPPSMYNVIFLNDDYSTMEFVIACLREVFNKNTEESVQIMLKVHNEGKAVAGQYTKDIAFTKQQIALDFAKQYEQPLQIVLEKVA